MSGVPLEALAALWNHRDRRRNEREARRYQKGIEFRNFLVSRCAAGEQTAVEVCHAARMARDAGASGLESMVVQPQNAMRTLQRLMQEIAPPPVLLPI